MRKVMRVADIVIIVLLAIALGGGLVMLDLYTDGAHRKWRITTPRTEYYCDNVEVSDYTVVASSCGMEGREFSITLPLIGTEIKRRY